MTIARFLALGGVLLLVAQSALAWNAAGHMIIAAHAWQEMEPVVRDRATEILQRHPEFQKWRTAYERGPKDVDFGAYVFMRASVWPDEIRRTGGPHDHATWHYINFPFTPPEFDSGKVEPLPQKEHVLSAIARCGEILNDKDADAESQAVHLAWLLHLIGDIHQPLHTTALVTEDYPTGDRGGNDFWIIAKRAPINLHSFWDGLLGSSKNMRELWNAATKLRAGQTGASPRDANEEDPNRWAYESRYSAFETAYLGGRLAGGKDAASAKRLPGDYPKQAKETAEARAYLAGVRTAARLTETFRKKDTSLPANPVAGNRGEFDRTPGTGAD